MTATMTATVMRRSIWIHPLSDLLPLTLAHDRGGCKRCQNGSVSVLPSDAAGVGLRGCVEGGAGTAAVGVWRGLIQRRRGNLGVASRETARAVHARLGRVVKMSVRFISILVALVVAVAVPGVAQAEPPLENIHYEAADAGSFEDCGLTINFDFTASGHFMLRELNGSDGQAFLQHDNFQTREVLTNAATGAFMVIRTHGLFKDLTARHVEGNVWEFITHLVGQTFVVEDSDGNVVLRDRGLVTLRTLFDTLGDSQPGGETLEVEITGVHGPHPRLLTDFCAIATDLIG